MKKKIANFGGKLFRKIDYKFEKRVPAVYEKGTVSLLQLNPHLQCVTITGGCAEDGTALCCGLQISKGSYCKKHNDRYYLPREE